MRPLGKVVIGTTLIFLACLSTSWCEDDIVFIHHSCGRAWLNRGLHDSLLSKDYIDEVNDIYVDTDVEADATRPDSLQNGNLPPGRYTNMDHWIMWFNDYLEGVINHGCSTGINRIVMFKSCYPISNVSYDDSGSADPFSSSRSVANYKAVYRHPDGPGHIYTCQKNGRTYKPLEDIFAENQAILFIVVTAPPRHYAPTDATNDTEGQRARDFNNWLKNEWLVKYNESHPGLNNVAVFDWFDILAYPDDHIDHPNRLREEYGGDLNNSHPNPLADYYSSDLFAGNAVNFIDCAWNTFDGASDVVYGDIDGDGNVIVNDVCLAAQHAIRKAVLSGRSLRAANVDLHDNGEVTVNDVILIARRAIGRILQFPIEEN